MDGNPVYRRSSVPSGTGYAESLRRPAPVAHPDSVLGTWNKNRVGGGEDVLHWSPVRNLYYNGSFSHGHFLKCEIQYEVILWLERR